MKPDLEKFERQKPEGEHIVDWIQKVKLSEALY
jgi:hypothetical protein